MEHTQPFCDYSLTLEQIQRLKRHFFHYLRNLSVRNTQPDGTQVPENAVRVRNAVWYLREHIFGNPYIFHWLIYNLTYYPYDWQHREVNGTNAQARDIFGSVIKTLLNETVPRDVLVLDNPSDDARMGSMICANLTRTLEQ